VRGLTAEEYASLAHLQLTMARGLILPTFYTSETVHRLIARGAISAQLGPRCRCGKCFGWCPTPSGLLAMRCYELVRRVPDLNGAS
jgi:hypothetical protein